MESLKNFLAPMFVTICMMLIAACSASDVSASNSATECLPLPVNLAYNPVEQKPPAKDPIPHNISTAWEPQLSQNRAVKKLFTEGHLEMATRLDTELWIVARGPEKIFRYSPPDKEFGEYILEIREGVIAHPKNLIVVSGNNLIIQGDYWDENLNHEAYLFQFDEASNRFNILFPNIFTDISLSPRSKFVEGDDDILWYISEIGSLNTLDPTSGEVKEVIHDLDGYRIDFNSLVIDKYNHIWITVFKPDEAYIGANFGNNSVYRYDPNSGRVDEFFSPRNPLHDEIGFFTLFIDSHDYLWASTLGILKFDDDHQQATWETIFPSSAFITDRGQGDLKYNWVQGWIELESQQRYLWYRSVAGVIRLDTEENNWCLLSTFNSPIVEDVNGDIWILSEGQILKYLQE